MLLLRLVRLLLLLWLVRLLLTRLWWLVLRLLLARLWWLWLSLLELRLVLRLLVLRLGIWRWSPVRALGWIGARRRVQRVWLE